MESPVCRKKTLRILVIVDLPWDIRLGACRVWMELVEQWRGLGHTVAHFSFSEAFPREGKSGISSALQHLTFPRKAAAFVRANADRFDVIDAAIGTLPYAKAALGFRGLIVARSIGLYRFYHQFENTVEKRWPGKKRGRASGRLFYGFARRRHGRAAAASLQKADLINLPNEAEAAALRRDTSITAPITVQPYGLTDEMRAALRDAADPPEDRLRQRRVCFIGSWSARKGAYDWPRIISEVSKRVPEVRFRFLGTLTDDRTVRNALGGLSTEAVEIVSSYQPEELPRLLADCTAGAFPSYVEGFGLAVLEQLAAGIPTVAYHTPGPADLLGRGLPDLLSPIGEIERFVSLVCKLLSCSLPDYREMTQKSSAIAEEFSWAKIAAETLESYRAAMADQSGTQNNKKMLSPVDPLSEAALKSPHNGSSSIACTLFEGDYHAGLGALLNSLHAKGFRGDFYAGYREEMPPWSREKARQNGAGWIYDVGRDCRLHFVPVRPSQHFTNYKPNFVLSLMELCPQAQNFFFFDPDIIVRADWDFFERWVARGIALCEDVNDYLPRRHPVRQAWKEYLQKAGMPVQQEPEKFYNAGFFGVRREHYAFLENWRDLFACRARDGANLKDFVLFDFVYPYMSTDQDLMNVALMLVPHPISAVGPEGMGFRPGGYVMSHSAGDIKSWSKHFIWEALRGRAPTAADKEFVRYTRSPIEVCSGPQLAVKRMGVSIGALIGRFYRRGGA